MTIAVDLDAGDALRWPRQVLLGLDQLIGLEPGILRLSYFSHLSQAEIAVVLDVPLSRVRRDAALGLQHLAQYLEQTDG